LTSETALASAHARLLASRDIQFEFRGAARPPDPPNWLIHLMEALMKGLVAAAPVLKYVFWGGLIVLVVTVAWFVARDIVRLRRGDRAAPADLAEVPALWRPSEAAARALLSDADALAAEGRYAEAAHILLVRSVDDFEGRRPGAVRPSFTSRDIGRLAAMPSEARRAFALIAEVVEKSLFGGRPVDAQVFARCRSAYSEFALPERWA